jgi:heme-degrading monooxygenase HmoA
MAVSRLSPFSSRIQNALSIRRKLLKNFCLGTAGLLLSESQSTPFLAETAEGSVQLHIYIEVKPGKGSELEKLYHSSYVPAIKVQDGFLASRLLRHYESKSKYEIDISFRTERQRAAWAQSKEHQGAWPKIQDVGEKITWQGFDVLA